MARNIPTENTFDIKNREMSSKTLDSSKCQVFPNELESQDDYEGFTEWLNTFELFRGKKSEDDFNNDNRVVGKFKVS